MNRNVQQKDLVQIDPEFEIIYVTEGESSEGELQAIDDFEEIADFGVVVGIATIVGVVWGIGVTIYQLAKEDKPASSSEATSTSTCETNVKVYCTCDCSNISYSLPQTTNLSSDLPTQNKETLGAGTSGKTKDGDEFAPMIVQSGTTGTKDGDEFPPMIVQSGTTGTKDGDEFPPMIVQSGTTEGQMSDEFQEIPDPDSTDIAQPDWSLETPSDAQTKLSKIQEEASERTFDSEEAQAGFIRDRMKEEGIKFGITRTGSKSVKDVDLTDPAGVAEKLKALGWSNEGLISQVVNEANSVFHDVESFAKQVQGSLSTELKSLDSASEFASEWNKLVSSGYFDQPAVQDPILQSPKESTRETRLIMNIESPSGMLSRVSVGSTTVWVEDSDVEPGFHPASFRSIFDESTWM